MTQPAAAGQAPTDAGASSQTTPPAAAAAPAAGATTDPNAKPATGGAPAGQAAGADGKQGETGNKDGAPAGESKVPATYDLKVPEGAEKFVDQADVDTFAKVARENGWTNEEAQAAFENQADAFAARLTALRTETENDPTYGKDHLEASQQLARRAIDRVRPKGHARSDSFNRFLEKTGAGNHIEMFAFLADIGRLMAEDKPPAVGGTEKPGEQRSAAEVLYGAK